MLYEPKWEVTTEPWQHVLLDAASYIEQHGWVQFAYRDGEKACAFAAIALSAATERDSYDAESKMKRYLNDNVQAWNDTKGRTQREVIDALRKCAECTPS